MIGRYGAAATPPPKSTRRFGQISATVRASRPRALGRGEDLLEQEREPAGRARDGPHVVVQVPLGDDPQLLVVVAIVRTSSSGRYTGRVNRGIFVTISAGFDVTSTGPSRFIVVGGKRPRVKPEKRSSSPDSRR